MRIFPATSAIIALVFSLTIGVHGLNAPQSPSKIDIKQLGPQIGEKAPDFELQDQFGKKWSRDSIMGPNGAMVVFFRSADW